MKPEFERTAMLLGEEAVDRLDTKKVAIFGVGGVGGFAAEALARTGIGRFVLIDNDTVNLSNINRQVIALHSTVLRPKVEVMRERILDINPDANIEERQTFHLPGMPLDFLDDCDYVVDAIDTISAKLDIVKYCFERKIPIISAMGAGNKTDPTRFQCADIYDTSVCPLCKVMRRELKKRGVHSLKVVFSDEEPLKPLASAGEKIESGSHPRRQTPGSLAFVPSVMGLIIAKEVVFDIIGG